MKAIDRLLKYVVVKTPSNEENDQHCPSAECEFDLARLLEGELRAMGVEDVRVSDDCFVYAKVPATPGYENACRLGLIAHMDTVSQFCEGPITPVITRDYDGGDLPLGTSGRTLAVRDFPHLPTLAGKTLLTSNGTTILGVDDKAGIAEILCALEQVLQEGRPHGPLRIAFTPDEEIGTGASHFDVDGFDAQLAYTLDGDTQGEIQYECFNACMATFDFQGVSVHPGSAKDIMVNAALVACEANAMLPSAETPRHTEGYEGFYHLLGINGDETHTTMSYIVRDFYAAGMDARKRTLRHIEKTLNERWGAGTVTLAIRDQYRNMEEVVRNHPRVIELARQACERAGIEPLVSAIRGGTDGCQLSFRGLPCPNLGTGGHGYHGPYEHVTAEAMDDVVRMLVELIGLYANE